MKFDFLNQKELICKTASKRKHTACKSYISLTETTSHPKRFGNKCAIYCLVLSLSQYTLVLTNTLVICSFLVSTMSPWWNGWHRRCWVYDGWIELRICQFFHCVMSQQVTAQRFELLFSFFMNNSSVFFNGFTEVFCIDLIFPIQKHVMTSEKWLDRQVRRASLSVMCQL